MKKLAALLLITLTMASSLVYLSPQAVFAASNSAQSQVQAGVDATGSSGSGDLTGVVNAIINVMSVIVGVLAVIMIIYGGFRYVTSGGDSGSVSGAKNTIIYAIVGLVIVVLAQTIVKFVLKSIM